ncbi:MAG: hypothetical protein IKV64_04800 [Clostridia bacterium]|nr:hypothetical protein [Clostridia bacterium]
MAVVSEGTQNKIISKFLGINRGEYSVTGEMMHAQNITADEYPCLKAAKAPKALLVKTTNGQAIKNIRAAIAPGGVYDGTFTGVAGTEFYYKGRGIPFFGDAKIPAKGDVFLHEINGNIIICCYNNFDDRCLLFYNYNNYTKHSERVSKGYVVRCDCAQFVSASSNFLKTLPAAANSSTETTYKFYGDAELYFNNFKVGDNIVIDNLVSRYNEATGSTYEYARETLIRKSKYESAGKDDEVVCIVSAVDARKNGEMSSLDYVAYNINGEVVIPKNYINFSYNDDYRLTSANHTGAVIRKAMPIMNSVCIQNNRLWGVNPNGEYIYASKSGDFREFNKFEGISSDSYYVGIGSGGEFVGIYAYKNYVMAFKRNCMYLISGTLPTNFTISRTVEGIGCIDIKSCSICGTSLYFLAQDGFYRFDGVSFEKISKKLGYKYIAATGHGTNNKYYAYATREDGQKELLVFDAQRGLWHTMSSGTVNGFFSCDGKDYLVCTDDVYQIEGENNNSWIAESVEFYDEGCENSYVNEIWIRAKIAMGKKIRVFSITDNSKTTEHQSCEGTGKMLTYRIPTRWRNAKNYRIKLQGDGDATVYDIRLKTADGGKKHKR